MKKILLAVAIAFALCAPALRAAPTAFSFLKFVSSARAAGLSGSFVTFENDASSLYYNPATIWTVETKPLSVTFFKHVLDINSGNAAYVFNVPDVGKFAVSAVFSSYGSFNRSDVQGNVLGDFGAQDVAFGGSFSNEIDSNFYYGVTLKFLYSGLDDLSSTAFAVDAGLFYKLKDGRTNLGVSILNAGAQLSTFDGSAARLPLDVRLGVSHRMKGMPLLVNASIHHLADPDTKFLERFRNFSVGGELSLGEYIKLRLGYDNYFRNFTGAEQNKGLTGISLGAGIATDKISLDYGLAGLGSSISVHRFSVNLEI